MDSEAASILEVGINGERRNMPFDVLPTHLTDLLDHPANGFLSNGDEAYDPR